MPVITPSETNLTETGLIQSEIKQTKWDPSYKETLKPASLHSPFLSKMWVDDIINTHREEEEQPNVP